MIEVKHLTKKYEEKVALSNVNMTISDGSIVGIVGPNGAGKSTFMKILVGLLKDFQGEVNYNIEMRKHFKKLIGYLPEQRGLYEKLDVESQLMFFGGLRGLSHKECKEQISLWLTKFNIEDWRHRMVSELSKGMQQKIQFVSCLINNPEIVFMDEPFSGLDPVNLNYFCKVIRDYAEINQSTILLSTHNMESVEKVCTHVAIIVNSRLVVFDTIENVKKKYSKENSYRIRVPSYKENIVDEIMTFDSSVRVLKVESLNSNDIEVSVEFTKAESKERFIKDFVTRKYILLWEHLVPDMNDIFIKLVNENL